MYDVLNIQLAIEHLPFTEREILARWLDELQSSDHRHRVEEAQLTYAPAETPFMSVEEYLTFEAASPVRHEYINGVLHAMSGVSVSHARIVHRLDVALDRHLRGGPCEPFVSDLKVFIRLSGQQIFYYPDVVVDCRPADRGSHYLTAPKLVAEVLSPSTQHIDLREKAMSYRWLASLEEYVVIAQDEPRVFVRRRGEGWRPHVYGGRDAIADLRSIGLSLPLTEIYEGTL